MYRSIGSRRSRRGVSVWMMDPLYPLLVAYVGAPMLIGGIAQFLGGHWLWAAIGLVTFIPTVATLRIAAGDPGTLRVTRRWLLIPYERSQVALAQLRAEYAVPESDGLDLLTDGRWEFECRDAPARLAELRAASADLATPMAQTRARR